MPSVALQNGVTVCAPAHMANGSDSCGEFSHILLCRIPGFCGSVIYWMNARVTPASWPCFARSQLMRHIPTVPSTLRIGHGWPDRILGLLIAFAPIGIVWEDRLQSAEFGCICRSINLLTRGQLALRFCSLTHQCRTNGSSPADTEHAANV